MIRRGTRSRSWLASSLFLLAPTLVVADDAAPPALVVIDLRPAEEKEGVGLTELTGKCNAKVFRIADVASDPLKVDVLREDLSNIDFGAAKTLTVLDWSIYYNKQVRESGGGKLQSIGVGGYTIPTAKKKERRAGSVCTRRDSAGGWYDGDEIHSSYFPIVSEFTGTYGGKPVSARVVYSPTRKLTGKFEGAEDDTQALLDVIHQTSEQLAEALAALSRR